MWIEAHVLAAERLHGDDTPVPVLAKGKTDKGRLWVYVRDDRPFAGPPRRPPSSGSRGIARASIQGATSNAGAASCRRTPYAGFGALYAPDRSPGAVTEALCWAHGRRKFFELADLAARRPKPGIPKDVKAISPLALEAVRRIDVLFELERRLNGADAATRLALRQEEATPLVRDLERWMRAERERLSRHADVARAMDYMLKRFDRFTRFLQDGRVCLTNNAAERALRGVALGRKAWLFCGSTRGGDRAASMYTLIATAKLNDVDPQAWLADALARIAELPLSRLDELLPWNWRPRSAALAA
jgi:transposase